MALQRLKPKTGQIGLYLLLLAIILGLMALMRWLPERNPERAPRPFTIALVCMSEIVQTDSTGLKGRAIEFAATLESMINTKVKIIPVADREAALYALRNGMAEIAGPMIAAGADSTAAYSEVVEWKCFTPSDGAAQQHPAALRTASDSITLPLRWAVRRSDTALLRTVNNLLD